MTTTRADTIADAAITVLAERGMRGLTHRAVDEAADVPAGATSNVARSRAALLETMLRRLADVEGDDYPDPPTAGDPRAQLVDIAAQGLHRALTTGRQRTAARLELALEANRRPELRRLYDQLGRAFHLLATDLLARAGSRDPAAAAYWLIAACDGVLLHSVVGTGHGRHITPEELRTRVRALVDALLPG